MSEANRILDLDDDGALEVRLGGQIFWLRQQRRAVLEKVVKSIYPEESPALPEQATNQQFLEHASQTWEDTIPTFALMLGVEEADTNYAATVDHLHLHLTFPKAKKVFEAWWALNRVEDFFLHAGNPLIPEARLKAFLDGTGVADATPAEAPTSNAMRTTN